MILTTKAALVLGLVFVAVELVIGSMVGLGVAALAYRGRFTKALRLRAALLGGVAFVSGMLLSGWADAQSPASWLRMAVARYGLAVSLVICCAAALLAGVRSERPRTNDERPT